MNFTCYYCGWTGLSFYFVVDHRMPTSRGGSDGTFNKRIICSGCNSQKGAKTELEYLMWRLFNSTDANFGPN